MLPSGYLQLEYLESTGTQYIKTSVIPNTSTKVNIRCSWLSLSLVWGFIFGSNTNHSSGANSYGLSIRNDGYFYLQYIGDHQSSFNWSLNTIYEIETYSNRGEQYLKVNGNKVYTQSSTSYPSTSAQLSLFGCLTNNSGFNWGANARIYSCKIETNNTLVRDYIPAMRLSDNVVGLYDLQNDVFYTNAGSGTFLHGKVIATENIILEDNPLIFNLEDDVSLQANFLKKSGGKKYIIGE